MENIGRLVAGVASVGSNNLCPMLMKFCLEVIFGGIHLNKSIRTTMRLKLTMSTGHFGIIWMTLRQVGSIETVFPVISDHFLP